MRFVTTNGARIATEAFGSPDDPTLLLIMGATASMLGWPDALCTGLSGHGLHVIRFDHRDTGASTTVPPGQADYAVEDLAADALAILDAYGVREAALLGMSLGGYIAQMLALQHPERVSALVLASSEPLGWDGPALPHIAPQVIAYFDALATLDWTDREAVADFLLGLERLNAGSGQPFDTAGAEARIARVLQRSTSPASMFNHATLSTREDWTGRFRAIARPVLVMHGELDPVLPVENGRAIAAGIPGATLLELPGVGHELPAPHLPMLAERVAAHVLAATGGASRRG